jgi:hypothetical protein
VRLRALLELEGVTWRHDIDRDPFAAVAMARLEERLGVRATYYVMLRSPYYNPFSFEVRDAVEQLAWMGHRIGVHVELDRPREAIISEVEVEARCVQQRAMLRSAVPSVAVTRAVSLHCPPHSWVWRDIPNFDSLYAPRWKGHYRSDSAPPGGRGRFRYGDPEDFNERPLQVVLHPEHWFRSTEPPDRLYYWR